MEGQFRKALAETTCGECGKPIVTGEHMIVVPVGRIYRAFHISCMAQMVADEPITREIAML